MMPTVYYAGNTMVVELTSVRDVTGTALAAGSGTVTVFDTGGVQLGTGAITFVSAGLFRGVLAHTIAVEVGTEVLVDAILDNAGQRGRWRQVVPVVYRALTP